MKTSRWTLLVSFAALLAMVGCEDNDISVFGATQGGPKPPVNNPPSVTSVSASVSSTTMGSVSLSAVVSDGDGGTNVSYFWSAVPVAGITITNATSSTTTATITAAGSYVITLAVTDKGVPPKTASNQIAIIVGTTAGNPIAITEVDVVVDAGSTTSNFVLQVGSLPGEDLSAATGTSTTLLFVRPAPFIADQPQTATLDATPTTGGTTSNLQVVLTYQ